MAKCNIFESHLWLIRHMRNSAEERFHHSCKQIEHGKFQENKLKVI